MAYEIVFPSERVESGFQKALRNIPVDDQHDIVHAVRSLAERPRPEGKRIKRLKGHIIVSEFTAQYRLRVGSYRVLYDIDDKRKKVILLKLVKRDEHTYR